MGKHFKKNCGVSSCQNDTSKLIQKPFNPSRLLPLPSEHCLNEILKESKRQSSFLCRACKLLSGIYKVVTGNQSASSPGQILAPKDVPPKIHAFLINKNGKRVLTKKRYKTILAHAHKFNLFIDGFTKIVCHNSEKGELLTDTEFIMIKTYIETGKPLAPFQVTGYAKEYKKTEQDLAWSDKKLHDIWEQNDTIDDDQWKLLRNSSEMSEDTLHRFEKSAIKIFESARRKVDIKDDNGFLHFPQVQRKGRERLAKYQFKPETLAYSLIIPS